MRRIPVLLIVLVAVAACSGPSGAPVATGAASAPTASAGPVELSCAASIVTSPLPTWARTGFTPPDSAVPHVLGANGDIVGVVFGDPLVAPASETHGNKILWVPRVPLQVKTTAVPDNDLHIHAVLNGTTTTADRTVVGGPGPSLVDVPEAGCWTMHLSWSGRADAVAVPYHAG